MSMSDIPYAPFALWYAKSTAQPGKGDADLILESDAGDALAINKPQLAYAIPAHFGKRVTDTSESTAVDKTSPDTGTALSQVALYIDQQRNRSMTKAEDVRTTLLKMFYEKANDASFKKGRFGLETPDCPALDCVPSPTAGYKFTSFRQTPNQRTPNLLQVEVLLDFVGDHTRLGAFQP